MFAQAPYATLRALEVLWHATETIATSTNPLVDYRECFKELAAALRRFGCGGKLEVVLLHRHFDVAEGEFLFEYPDAEGNWYLTARPSAEFHDGLVPLTLKFTPGGEILGLVYAEPSPDYQDAGQSQDCLDACGKIIRRYKLENSLGIGVLDDEHGREPAIWNEFRLGERLMKKDTNLGGEGESIDTHFRLNAGEELISTCSCYGGGH